MSALINNEYGIKKGLSVPLLHSTIKKKTWSLRQVNKAVGCLRVFALPQAASNETCCCCLSASTQHAKNRQAMEEGCFKVFISLYNLYILYLGRRIEGWKLLSLLWPLKAFVMIISELQTVVMQLTICVFII